jgi:membrane protease YdiL (CAAX protease family)
MSTHQPQPPDRPAPERGITGVIRRHPLGVFFAWFFTVGQALAFTPVLIDTGLPAQVFVVASTLIGLLLPTVVITRIVAGRAGVRALWRRAVDVRVSLAWYALALLGLPLLAVVVTAALLGMPADLSPSVLGAALAGNLLLPLLLTFLPNNWWEEVAWQGFVQDRLQARRGPVLAALLTAPLFALQHVSLTVGNPPVVAVLMMLLLTVLVFPFRLLTAWIYNRTGSLFLVGLVHGTGNAVAGGSGFQDGFLARLYPDQVVAVLAHQLAYVVLAVIVVVATRGRLAARAKHTTAGPVPAPALLSAPLSRQGA